MSVGATLGQWSGWLRQRWLLLAGISAATGLLLYRLTSLPVAGHVSLPEQRLGINGGDWHNLLLNPFFLPYRALAWISRQALTAHPLLALRLPSVAVALVALLAIAYTLRRWYGPRTAFFGFIIIATSAAILHVGRLASVDVIYFASLPLLLLSHVALLQAPRIRSLLGLLLVATLLLYIPGMVWFVGLQLIWQRKLLVQTFRQMRGWKLRLLFGTLVTLSIVPLAYGFFKHPQLAYVLKWLGLPSVLPSVTHLLRNLFHSVSFIVFRSAEDPSRWLGSLPLLGAFMVVCLLAGIFFYIGHWQAERTRLLFFLSVLSVLLLTAGGPVSRSIIVPIVYIVALGGLAYLLHYWLSIFPRNMTARWLGIGIVCLVLGLSAAYDLRHYFVAWPHNSGTRAAFHYQPPR